MQRVQEIPPHEDELLGKLRMLGLTDYESRAYLTLIRGEELTAEEISRLSGIPLPRIYSVLDKLVRDSFAKSYNTRPMRFEALPPSIAFARLEKKKEQELTLQLNELRSTANNLRTTLETTYGSAKLRIRPEELLEPLSDLNSMEERTKSILESASEEILILTAEFRWFPKIYESLVRASKKGISVRVLMDANEPTTRQQAQTVRDLGVEVRGMPKGYYPLRGTIVDRGKLVFLIWSEAKESTKPAFIYRPSYTENRGLIRVFLDAFEMHWEKSKHLR